MRHLAPPERLDVDPGMISPAIRLKPGAVILAADDSVVARALLRV
ncbi:hypothetical protein [Massilia psychrophila]|nr:hypothetical protein [Massilia psychrophila]GGE89151.1 hypothetical protein GCM10008020_37720 [Massilia psychrophila]